MALSVDCVLCGASRQISPIFCILICLWGCITAKSVVFFHSTKQASTSQTAELLSGRYSSKPLLMASPPILYFGFCCCVKLFFFTNLMDFAPMWLLFPLKPLSLFFSWSCQCRERRVCVTNEILCRLWFVHYHLVHRVVGCLTEFSCPVLVRDFRERRRQGMGTPSLAFREALNDCDNLQQLCLLVSGSSRCYRCFLLYSAMARFFFFQK